MDARAIIDTSTSVKDADYSEVKEARGGAYYIMSPGLFANAYGLNSSYAIPSMPPPWWSRERDAVLRSLGRGLEPRWNGAINRTITKIAAKRWTLTDSDKVNTRLKHAQQVLLESDGRNGWVHLLSKHLRDYTGQDNGSFLEIERATTAYGSRVKRINTLDSARCTRTGDPEYPVIYRDNEGAEHALSWWQVLTFSDQPDPSETYNGVGFCAASRAYTTIYKMMALERYIAEKITGNRPLALYFVSGVNGKMFDDALQAAKEGQRAQGYSQFMGAMVFPLLDPKEAPGIVEIPLASLPDGFDAKQERDDAAMIYANALGIPVQDIQPLSGQGLGTGTQTEVLAEREANIGIGAWIAQLEQKLNDDVLPTSTTFRFNAKTTKEAAADAAAALTRAQERKTRIEAQELSVEEARQLAADAEDLPEAFLAEDDTPSGTVTDATKVNDGFEEGEQGAAQPQGQQPQGQQPQGPEAEAAQPKQSKLLQAVSRILAEKKEVANA